MDQTATFLVITIIAASLVLWTRAMLRLWSGEPLLPLESPSTRRWGLIDLGVAYFMMIVCQSLGRLAAVRAFNIPADATMESLSQDQMVALISGVGAGSLLAMIVAFAFTKLRTNSTLEEMGVSLERLPKDIQLGGGAFLMLAVPVYGLQVLLSRYVDPHHPLIDSVQANPSVALFLAAGCSAVISAPLLEEYLFRLMLQGWLEVAAKRPGADRLLFGEPKTRTIGADSAVNEEESPSHKSAPETKELTSPSRGYYWPIFVSAALFALVHVGQGPAPIPLFVLALGLGFLYQQTQRLAPCIVVHGLLNLSTFIMLVGQAYLG